MEITNESDLETLSSGSTDSNRPNKSIPAPPEDNFYSPQNRPFYAKSPYKPLDLTQQQIRLLQFLPSNVDGLLSFALLDNRPLESVRSRYTALSYCAGDPRKTKAIYVNGARFNAFANLEYALREVVEYWENNGMDAEEELMWVDQVCINQSNPEERSHQVGQMRDIYAAADRVLIALGTEGGKERSGLWIEWLLEVKQKFQAARSDSDGLITLPDELSEDWMFDYLVKNLSDEKFQDGFINFHQMIRSPWWQRGWIYQEFIVASEAIFLYGGASVSWWDMYIVLFYDVLKGNFKVFRALSTKIMEWCAGGPILLLHRTAISERPSYERLSQLRQYKNERDFLEAAYLLMRRKHFWKGPTGLMGWIDSSRTCQTSDPRDRVYAFLGLAHPQYNIMPDYSPSNTMEILTLEVVRKVLEAEGTLDFLKYVRTRQFTASSHYLNSSASPSWIPDLNRLHSNKDSVLDREQAGVIDHLKLTRVNASIDDSGTILTVEGIRLDAIPRGILRSAFGGDVVGGFRTMRGLLVKFNWNIMFEEVAYVWWFPGSRFVAVLAPKESVPTRPFLKDNHWQFPKDNHWQFLYTSSMIPRYYNKDEWAKSVTTLVFDGDLDSLLAMDGVTKEVIQIH